MYTKNDSKYHCNILMYSKINVLPIKNHSKKRLYLTLSKIILLLKLNMDI